MPKPFAQSQCAIRLATAARGIISDSDLQSIFSAIDSRRSEGQVEDIAKEASQKFLDQKQYEAFRQKSTTIFNARAYSRMKTTVGRWVQKGMAPHKALEAYSLGSSGDPGIGTRDNPATQREHLQQRQKNVILTNLKKEKLDSYVLDKNHAFDQAILEARQLANTADPKDRAALPMTEYKKLRPDQQGAVSRIAAMFNDQMGELRGQLNQEGAFPGQRDGYMGEQSHDRMKIRNASRSGQLTMTDRATEADRVAYTRDLANWIDPEKTRSNLVRLGRMGALEDLDPDKFNNSLWTVFATGIRKDPRGEGLSGFGGNIAAEAEKARILEFKDAGSFNAYNKKYGSGSVWQSHMDQIDHMAHQIMTLRYFGPSAEHNFQRLTKEVGVGLRNKLEALQSGGDHKATLEKATMSRSGKNLEEARGRLNELVDKPITNKETGMVAKITKGSIKKITSDKAIKQSVSGPAHTLAAANVDKLFENAHLLDSEPDRSGSPNVKGVHRFYAPMQMGSKVLPVKLTVKELASPDANHLYSLEALDIEKPAGLAPDKSGIAQGASEDSPLPAGSTDKVRAMVDEVKTAQGMQRYAGMSPEDRTTEINRTLKQTDQLANSRASQYLDAYLGITKDSGNMTQARIVDNVMAIQRMGLLGSSIFSQLSALFPAFLQSRYAGVGLLQSAFGPLFGALGRMGKEDLQNFIRRQGVGMEGMLGHLHSSLIGDDYTPGSIMKSMEAKFFKGVGLTQWNDILAASHVMTVSNEMAHNAGLKFEQLPFAIRRHLGDYNISPKEWDLVRKYAPTKFNEYDVMASDRLRSIPDEEMNAATGKSTAYAAKSGRLDLEAKLANLFQDSSDYARVQHDLKTSQLIPHGIRGTLGGDALRLTMQFATFNFAHGQRVLQRQWKSSSFPEFLFKTLGGLTMTGTLAYSLRQLAAGKNPMANTALWDGSDKTKQCESWGKLLAAGAGQAGVGAMLGDLLFSQTYDNGRGSSALQPILGPTGDDLTQMVQFGRDALLKGKLDSDQMLRFAQGHVPFVNTWWIKPFVNYGLLYGLEEQLNPGVLERMEQHSKQAGDPYWLSPSQNAVR